MAWMLPQVLGQGRPQVPGSPSQPSPQGPRGEGGLCIGNDHRGHFLRAPKAPQPAWASLYPEGVTGVKGIGSQGVLSAPLCSGEQGFTFSPPTLSACTPDNSPSCAQTPGVSRPTHTVQATSLPPWPSVSHCRGPCATQWCIPGASAPSREPPGSGSSLPSFLWAKPTTHWPCRDWSVPWAVGSQH